MSESPRRGEGSPSPHPTPWRTVIGFGIFVLLGPVTLLGAAGDERWTWGWLFVLLYVGSAVGSRMAVLTKNPDLLVERGRFTQAPGVKAWDRVLVGIVALWGPLVTFAVAGFDRRFAWGPGVPSALQVSALGLMLVGHLLSIWAMVVNKYFSAVVRIQTDRGHQVVRHGPYALIRHPGYAGGLLASLATPLVLDALWACVPAALGVAALVVRAALEDNMLRRELDGYEAYAAEVRYRLLPGVW